MAASLARFAKSTNHISQGDRREQHGRALFDRNLSFPVWHRQIRPGPWHGLHHTVMESHQHPRTVSTPEDAAHAPALTAGAALLRRDRECRTTQCNIGCSLSLG